MAFDPGPILNTLSNTKFQKDNNAAYQVLKKIIDALVGLDTTIAEVQTFAESVEELASGGRAIRIVQPSTLTAPVAVSLADNVRGFTIIKDYAGNASVNNITLTGTLEGVAGVVINTDYGLERVYKSSKDGLYKRW